MTIKSKMTQKTLNEIEYLTRVKLTLGSLLWAIRTADVITQVDFAKKLGMSKQQLCDIERNRKAVSPTLAAQYARKLGYSKEQFIRLCLQDMLNRARLNVNVEITSKKKKTGTHSESSK